MAKNIHSDALQKIMDDMDSMEGQELYKPAEASGDGISITISLPKGDGNPNLIKTDGGNGGGGPANTAPKPEDVKSPEEGVDGKVKDKEPFEDENVAGDMDNIMPPFLRKKKR